MPQRPRAEDQPRGAVALLLGRSLRDRLLCRDGGAGLHDAAAGGRVPFPLII